MPVVNGLESARALKRLMPSVPIIMFTFYVEPFVEQEARTAGVNEVVSKSEHISVLMGKARRLLYSRRCMIISVPNQETQALPS